MKKYVDTIVIAVMAVVVAGFIYFLYLGSGGGWPLQTFLALGGIGVLPLLTLSVWRRSKAKLAVLGVFVLSIVVLWALPWTPRDHFLNHLWQIKPGMTLAQADVIMRPYAKWSGIPRAGLARRGELVDTQVVYRHSDSPDYGGDFGIVDVKRGKVVRVRFHPD